MSNFIALIAIVVSIYGIYLSYRLNITFTRRNEDKMLLDELLGILKDIQAQSAHFFLDYKEDRSSHHIYVATISSKTSIAQFLIHTLQQNKRTILKSNINEPFSDLYLYSTLNAEVVNEQTPEQNTAQFSDMDSAYLKCVSIIHLAFHKI